MIVVDTNVVAYLLTASGPETAAAERTLARDPEWAAPLLWRSEFRNVLALYMRLQHLPLGAALNAVARADALFAGREFDVDSGRVLTLAAASGRTAYDCEFVTVAQELRVPLVTNDRQVLASFPDLAVALADFAGA